MSIPRRLGRLARGFLGEERLRETFRAGRERSEALKGAFGAAWRGATEEWRAYEERAAEERAPSWPSDDYRGTATQRPPIRKYPPEVIAAYHRLGLGPGAGLEEIRLRRRELVKRHHPDRFEDPELGRRAEQRTAEINAAHDAIERYLLTS